MALTSLTNLQPLHVHSVGVSTFDGSVSVGGTLTYEDVTNVDAIGIVTARSGVNVSGGQLDVGSNIKLGNAGVITATSFVGNGSGLTGLNSDLVNDTSPQLGGDLDLNGNSILLDDNEKIFIGTSNDASLFNTGTYLFLKNHNGNVAIQASGTGSVISLQKYDNSDIGLQYVVDGKIQLNYDNVSMFETESRGAFVKKGNGSDTTFTVGSTDASGVRICLDGDSNGDAYGNDYAFLQHDSSGDFIISADNPAGNSNLIFKSGNSSEQARITSSGQLRAGDESSSDRTGYRHQFSSTAGSGDVLSIQNPSNTDGQGIGLGFWARNTNNAAIEVAKIKAVIDETQANSSQKGSLKFFTNKDASLGERMQINSAGNVRITGSTHSNQGTSAGNVPLQIVGGGNNVVTMFLGNGNTAGNGVNDYSADIRFNGAAVAWGDISYYPTGNSNGGAFRFTGNGSTVSSQGNRSLGCSGIFINGTAQAQHLDDYEEGSYTPNVQTDNGVNCGMAVAQGYYVKVGKIVTVHLKIQTNSHNSVNTAAQYKVSLPYTSQAQGDTQGTLMCSIWSIGSSAISWMGGQVHNNNAWTHLAYHNGNNNNTNNLQPNNAGNQLQFRGTVVYRSDS